jgi:hypothetical protein
MKTCVSKCFSLQEQTKYHKQNASGWVAYTTENYFLTTVEVGSLRSRSHQACLLLRSPSLAYSWPFFPPCRHMGFLLCRCMPTVYVPKFPLLFLFLFFFGLCLGWTQTLTLARQVFYHVSHAPILFCFNYFSDGGLMFLQGAKLDCDPAIYASYIARTTWHHGQLIGWARVPLTFCQ